MRCPPCSIDNPDGARRLAVFEAPGGLAVFGAPGGGARATEAFAASVAELLDRSPA